MANYTKLASHFLIRTTENGTLKIYSKLHKICSICPLSLQSRKICAICTNFLRFSVPTGKIAKISGNLHFGQITQNSPAIFQFGPRKMELPKFTANCTKSAQFAHCHCKSCKICAICANFPRFSVPMGKIAKISGNLCSGQIMQNLPAIFQFGPRKMELPKFTANCAKSAQFADRHHKSHEICAICTNFPRFSVPTGRIVKFRDICVPL